MPEENVSGVNDLLSEAATATQGMIPGIQQKGNLTSFGPSPIVQPPPMPKFQAPEQQFAKAGNEFQTGSGRKRADRQALFSNTANLIKAGADYVQAKKQRALTMDIQRLMQYQQGRQEALDTLKENPNDADAKKALEINTQNINDITSDPKKSKQLQKAFNIDLFGGGKNKQENQSLMEAWKQFQQKQQAGDKTALNPAAEKFMQSQPMRQSLSPEAAAQAQAIKAGLIPAAGAILKANTDIYKAMTTAKTAEERNSVITKAAQIRAEAEEKHAGALVDAANIRALGQKMAAEIHSKAQMYIANKVSATWDRRINAMEIISAGKNKTEQEKNAARFDIDKIKATNSVIGNFAKEANTYNTRLKALKEENKALQIELDKKGSSFWGLKTSAANDTDSKMMRMKITRNNAEMKDLEKNLGDVQQKMDNAEKMGIISIQSLIGDNSDLNNNTGSNSGVDINDDDVPPEN